jgi:GTP-binding protein
MDRPDAQPNVVHEQVFDLLVELEAEEHALEFPTLYAAGRNGWATAELENAERAVAGEGGAADIHELFDAIIEHVPVPDMDGDSPLQALITTLDYSDYVGRIGIGRVFAGTLTAGAQVAVIGRDGEQSTQKIGQLMRFDGLGRTVVERVDVGDIFAVVGLENVDIGDTLADPADPVALPAVAIDEPTLRMTFRINDSPLSGRDGKYVTSRQLRDRLDRELQSNVALRVEQRGDEFVVWGRGLLHLGILLENMRREGYELSVGKPEVVFHTGREGEKLEPIERLVVDAPNAVVGRVMELVGERRAQMLHMHSGATRTQLEFSIPARGLIGLRSRVLTATAGEGIMHHRFEEFGPYRGEIAGRINGVMVATESGQATGYAIEGLADRGVMFVTPGDEVYEGQVVGEHNRDADLPVNVVRGKKLTNMRSATKEATVTLKAPREMTLESALEYIEADELVEVTPRFVRLRKSLLKENDRKRASRSAAGARVPAAVG